MKKKRNRHKKNSDKINIFLRICAELTQSMYSRLARGFDSAAITGILSYYAFASLETPVIGKGSIYYKYYL